MIKIDNLTYAYGDSLPSISNATAEIPAGIQLLLGPNGSGKSTLLKLIGSILKPVQGQILIDSIPCERKPSQLEQIFYLEENQLMPLNNIEEMVKYHAKFYPAFSIERLRANLDSFGLNGKEKFSDLSLGFRQKANVAYALALGVKTLLLDEPTNGMDIYSKKIFNRLLASNLEPEQTIIIATHTVHPMRNLFDGLIILNHGIIEIAMSLDEMLTQIAFVTTPTMLSNAIYSECDVNGYHSIIPNIDGTESNIDFELLYSCIVSDRRSMLINQLNSTNTLWQTI